MESGILLVDKPEGPSSAEVVQRVKRALRAKKVGHLGTLDPFASGLLLLGINDGTKIAELFLTARKTYSGVITLGVETDTQDSTGKILETREVPSLTEAEIARLQEAFTGTLSQTPPMYSALKKGGVRLYRLARQGKEVSREPRRIQIERLRLSLSGPAEMKIEVACSKGTYIRTLAADMGKYLGCGAHLKSLRRLSCGLLTLDQALPVSAVEARGDQEKIPLISLSRALDFLRGLRLSDPVVARLRMGQQEALSGLPAPEGGEGMMRLLDSQDSLVALARWVDDAAGGRWRLFRVFGP
ncbi:MAG: tRNA pseudouridine(55) synthase TruB [Deltaproteobacteria bacterium]|nr:tRNA pseudouridine(55) synthase TruB [Deltaproteobacteria bacterium]